MKKNRSIPYGLLSFLIPIYGIIQYFIFKKGYNSNSKVVLRNTILGCVVWLLIIFFVLVGYTNRNVIEGYSINEWKEMINKDEYAITVLGLSTCPHCQEYKPVLNTLTKKYNLNAMFFELDELSDEYVDTLKNTIPFEKFDNSYPYTFITKDGKFISDTVGFVSKTATVDYLIENHIIK